MYGDKANGILTVRRVDKSYGQRKVVDGVSFEVGPGEVLGLLGPNGAGKTTIIRMVMGITAPDQGEVIYRLPGGPARGIPKARVGYVPEERGLYRDALVIDTLVFLAGLKGLDPLVARRRSLEWLERMDLARWARVRVDKLSKGMAQKVQFIAAVLHDPQLVVLDEPFSGLDPVYQELFGAEIQRLTGRGAAVLLSSHQMNLVEENCGRILFLHHGHRVFYGDTAEVRARYGGFRAVLRGRGPFDFLRQSPLVASAQLQEGRAVLALDPSASPAEFAASLPPGLDLDEVVVSRPSLHDIFVGLVKEVPEPDAPDL